MKITAMAGCKIPMFRYWFLSVLMVALLSISSCQKIVPPSISFYYWKTQFKLTEREQAILRNCHVKRLYIRYFDVVMNANVAIPNAPIEFVDQPPKMECIPVVFIRNNVLEPDGEDVDLLSSAIVNYVNQIDSVAGIKSKELQLDCDWSQLTKDNFMRLSALIKAKSGKRVSSTIRLHQVKYFKRTGVPPVDEGVLMFYNMGKLGDLSKNSIYDQQTASKYVSALSDYPLPLTPALPLFGWGVHKRGGNVVGLANKSGIGDFVSDTNFRRAGPLDFVAIRSSLKGGRFYQESDTVKMEFITSEQLLEMASVLGENLPNAPKEVVFYDLDETNFHKFGYDEDNLKKVCAGF